MNKRGASKYGVITFLLVVLILLMAAVLVVMLYGDRILSRFDLDEGVLRFIGVEGGGYHEESKPDKEESSGEEAAPPPEEAEDAQTSGEEAREPVMEDAYYEPEAAQGSEDSGGTETPDAQEETPPAGPDYTTVNNLPIGLSLNVYDFTVRSLGSVTKLEAAGGSGYYEWVSQNPAIASVDQSGNVTAVSNGITRVLVTDWTYKGECIVRVYSGNGNSGESDKQLNQTDITRRVSEGPYQLRLSGVSEGVSWRSTRPDVASVSNSGLVSPLSPGTTEIIASWEDQSRVCTVRVPREDG